MPHYCALCWPRVIDAAVVVREERMRGPLPLCTAHLVALAAIRLNVQTGRISDWFCGGHHDWYMLMPLLPLEEGEAC